MQDPYKKHTLFLFIVYRFKASIVWLKLFSKPNHIIFLICLTFCHMWMCVFWAHQRWETWISNIFSKCKLKWSWCMFDKHYIPAGHKCLVGDNIWWNKKICRCVLFMGGKTERNNECKDTSKMKTKTRSHCMWDLIFIMYSMRSTFWWIRQYV